MLHQVLLLAAFLFFAADALGAKARIGLTPLGLACYVLTLLL